MQDKTEVNKIEKEQKFLELKIDSVDISYQIKFNDIVLFRELHSSPITHSIPVNHWVINGKNQVEVAVNFRDQSKALDIAQSASLTVSLVLRIKNGDKERSVTLTKYDLGISEDKLKLAEQGKLTFSLENKADFIATKSWSDKDIEAEKKLLDSKTGSFDIKDWTATDRKKWTRYQQELNLDLGYPEWAYLTADDLGTTMTMSPDDFFAMTESLYTEYKNIWQLMKDKNKAALLPLFQQRSSEFDAAYYLTEGEKYADMDYSLSSAFEHKDLKLEEMVTSEYAQLRTEGNGKLAILRVGGVGEPLLYYGHVRDAFTRSYTLYFMRKDGKWIIIR